MSDQDDASAVAARAHSPGRTILLVEPDVRLRTEVAAYLRQCGYKVIEATGGDEAITFIREAIPIHVVFSDVNLPGGVDGFELARFAREHVPLVKVVLTSGTNRTAQQAADLCHQQNVIDKPYGHDELARRLRVLLSE